MFPQATHHYSLYFMKHNVPSDTYADYTSVSTTPFTGKQLRLLSKAASTSTYLPILQALNEVMTPEDIDLTVGDFFYLMAYMRLTAFKSNPMIAIWECTGNVYVDEEDNVHTVKDLQGLPEDTMVTSRPCNHINNVHTCMDDLSIIKCSEKPTSRLQLPLAKHIDEVQTLLRDEDIKFIVPAASWVREGETIQDKIDILQQEPDMALFDTASRYNGVIIHGVDTTVTHACSNCGRLARSAFNITPSSFFW